MERAAVVLASGPPPTSTTPGYWVLSLLIGVLIIVIAALLIAFAKWYKKQIDRDRATDELVALAPSLRQAVILLLGDDKLGVVGLPTQVRDLRTDLQAHIRSGHNGNGVVARKEPVT